LKAIVFDRHGGPEVLQLTEIPTPEPGSDQVLVRLKAAALNHVDLWVRQGWPGLKLDLPHIPGADGAGEIAALGAGVSGRSLAERVVINSSLSCGRCSFCLAGHDNQCDHWHLLGETIRGTYAEYVAVPAVNTVPLPAHVNERTAAAAGLVFHTAWHSLITRGRLQLGESVLIIGASGGVNTASIQIAKLAGARVYVIGSSPEKLDLARSLGADWTCDRSQEPDWGKALYLATGKRGVDVVVDNVGAGTMPASLRAACKGGRILTVGNTGGANLEIDNRFIFGKHLSILGSTMGTHADFAQVMTLVFEGKLTVALDRSYPLRDARAAQERLAAGEQLGKITLEI
jgi:NADPH:quinone reductase-like Zn-dependent oxidoreductase